MATSMYQVFLLAYFLEEELQDRATMHVVWSYSEFREYNMNVLSWVDGE